MSKLVLRSLSLTAGQIFPVHEVASFFMLVGNTGALKIQISIDDDPFSDFPVNYEFQEKKEDEHFNKVTFKNPNAGTVTIEYILSTGIVRSSPTIIALDKILAELQGDLTPETNWGLTYDVGLTAIKVLDANPDRKSLFMQAIIPPDVIILIGFDNSVSDTKFVRCLINSTLMGPFGTEFRMTDYRGEIWAIADNIDLPLTISEW